MKNTTTLMAFNLKVMFNSKCVLSLMQSYARVDVLGSKTLYLKAYAKN